MSFSSPLKEASFPTATTAKEVYRLLRDLPPDTVVTLDVDDTLITPVSRTFQTSNMIDEIKAHQHLYPNFEEIVSHWRLQRKVRLTDEDWPPVLADLKTAFRVYGLTAMHTGRFGAIASMEQWRYEELKGVSLTFSEGKEDTPLTDENEGPAFYQGIMMTGGWSKSETLARFWPFLETSTLAFVDDREAQLQDVQAFCHKRTIPFVGILYQKRESATEQKPSPDLYALQKKTLIEEEKWLEDEEAQQKLEDLA